MLFRSLATAPAHRGKGLAAQATAAWTHHPVLAARALRYSHDCNNRASARVTERLGLSFAGVSVALT